jgi:hypothetical protein
MLLMTIMLQLVMGMVVYSKTDQGLQVPKCSWEGAGDPRKFDGECMSGGVYSFDNISDVRSRVHLPTCTDAESLLVPVLTPCALVGHSCVVAVFTNTATWVGGCVDDSSGHAVAYPLATPSVVRNSMLYNYSQLEKARAPTVGLIELHRPCADFYDNDDLAVISFCDLSIIPVACSSRARSVQRLPLSTSVLGPSHRSSRLSTSSSHPIKKFLSPTHDLKFFSLIRSVFAAIISIVVRGQLNCQTRRNLLKQHANTTLQRTDTVD